jgi:peptide deformylase
MEREQMAIRNIVTKEDEILKKKSRPVEKFDERLWELLDDMAETMYHNDGVGLAAPQVGILRRVIVIDAGDGLIELINPVITASSGTQEEYEGCLSCPGEYGIVNARKK